MLRQFVTAAIAATAFCCATSSVDAVLVASWNFLDDNSIPNLDNSTTSATFAANSGAGSLVGVHASSATDWSTPVGNGTVDSLSANTWAVGDYWQFSFNTTGLKDVTLSFEAIGSNTGPRDFKVQTSTNGTTFTDTGFTYSLASSPSWSSTTYNPGHFKTFTIPTVLDYASTAYIRLVVNSTTAINGGTVATGGTSRIDSIVISAIPEPTAALFGSLLAGAFGLTVARRPAGRE